MSNAIFDARYDALCRTQALVKVGYSVIFFCEALLQPVPLATQFDFFVFADYINLRMTICAVKCNATFRAVCGLMQRVRYPHFAFASVAMSNVVHRITPP